MLAGVDKIAFVPLSKGGVYKRGFNQSEILALNLSKEFSIPVAKILEKTRRTHRQNELARDERLSNLAGAFRIKSNTSINGLTILLIDDVMTTGATLSECAGTLKASGAKEVRCFTLARGI